MREIDLHMGFAAMQADERSACADTPLKHSHFAAAERTIRQYAFPWSALTYSVPPLVWHPIGFIRTEKTILPALPDASSGRTIAALSVGPIVCLQLVVGRPHLAHGLANPRHTQTPEFPADEPVTGLTILDHLR
jgi:hypothetical protein